MDGNEKASTEASNIMTARYCKKAEMFAFMDCNEEGQRE